MRQRLLLVICLSWFSAVTSYADEIQVLSANNFRQLITAASPSFERTSGHRLVISFASTRGIIDLIKDSKPFDVVLVEDETVAALESQGAVARGSKRVLAIAEMVLMTRPENRVSANTVDELRTVLRRAKSIAYPNPSGGGLSGSLFARILSENALGEMVADKAKWGKNTADVVRMVEQKEVEIGASQRSETRTDVLVFASLPQSLGADVKLSGALSSRAQGSLPAAALLDYLSSSAAGEFITASRLKLVR